MQNINNSYGAVSFNTNSQSLNTNTLLKMKNRANEYYGSQSLLNKSKLSYMRSSKGAV